MNAVRRAVLLTFVSVLLVAGARGQKTTAQFLPPTGEHVTATPGEGTLFTHFFFAGNGFAPSRTVSVRLTLPDGSERRFRTLEGIENVWLARADGSFELDFVPAQRFPGAQPGHWQALFCGADAPTCQRVDFDIAP